MTTIKRNERINDLLRAQVSLLAHVSGTGGTIKAKAAREFAARLVSNQSRRESVWATIVNAGYLQPRGKGVYAITEAGEMMRKYWSDIFYPPNDVYAN
jgi:hypothetical protein